MLNATNITRGNTYTSTSDRGNGSSTSYIHVIDDTGSNCTSYKKYFRIHKLCGVIIPDGATAEQLIRLFEAIPAYLIVIDEVYEQAEKLLLTRVEEINKLLNEEDEIKF